MENTSGQDNSFFGVWAGKNNTGSNNSFFGRNAGLSNTTASGNSFFGFNAGQANKQCCNSFFGLSAGEANVDGIFNAFFGGFSGSKTNGGSNTFMGYAAGFGNVSGSVNTYIGTGAADAATGSGNTAVGWFAGVTTFSGLTNTGGDNNTFIGVQARPSVANLNHSTAIGAYSVVNTSDTIVLGKVAGTYNGVVRPADSVQIPGNLNVAGTVTGSFSGDGSGLTNLNASKITTGTLNNARLGLIPTANIADSAVTAPKIATGQVVKNLNGLTDNVTLAAGSNVTITPAGNTLTIAATGGGGSAILNQTTQQTGANFNIDGTGKANVFDAATQFNLGGKRILTTAQGDSSVNNLFVGFGAGASFTGQVDGNTFVGTVAGFSDTNGGFNSFFGYQAGSQNTTGGENSFFGFNSGTANVNGFANSSFGYQSGSANASGRNNSFFGHNTGFVSNADNNSFFGGEAGLTNRTGTSNTLVGANTDVSADNLTNATALGANAVVSQSNSLVLGSNASVGIGTSTPKAKLDVTGGNILVRSPGQGIILKSPDGATCRVLSIDNTGAMVLSAITCP
ncbi:MAG TPA: hypothetical protein VN920_14595 [Pyrinomonadaceae bacterium]|nr:hypothetical protein [Pyrinomonadaceae bacterium]